ncbi:MAG: DNA-binding domain-containing protein [Thiohalocapsa sp.]
MHALRELQQEFQRYVLHKSQGIEHQVVGTARVDVSTRLAIYANAYRLRLIEVLQSDFEGLHTLLGDAEFEKLARTYIDRHPSSHPNVRWFGAHMAEFLCQTAPYDAYSIFEETARFEWALTSAFDSADSTSIDTDAVMQIPVEAWPDMCPVLHDSAQRLNLQWNTVDIWQAIKADDTPAQPQMLDSPVGWVIWRQDLQLHFRSLEVDEAWAIDALIDGQNFGQICEGVCEWIDAQHAGDRAATLLKGWVTEGLVAAIRIG